MAYFADIVLNDFPGVQAVDADVGVPVHVVLHLHTHTHINKTLVLEL